MGCTSAKPKRTTSIEDVASKQPQNANQASDKNSQAYKGPSGDKDKSLHEKQINEMNAVEIPGAHKSFMAPDGIPFIDEDAESEPDDVQLVNGSYGKNVKFGSPDQNKNIAIVANKEAKISAINSASRTRPSALEENVPSGSARHQTDNVINKPTVISQIKMQEINVTSTNKQQNEGTSKMKSQTMLSSSKPKTDEELAATKIQAGIRGFLDRQKVKAIRAGVQHPENNFKHSARTEPSSGPKVTEHLMECHSDDLCNPRLDAAATKIQANYKGHRTCRDIKASHLKS